MTNLADKLQALAIEADREVKLAKTLEEIEALSIRFLGRKGELTGLLRGLADVTAEERPKLGNIANEIKTTIEAALTEARERLAGGAMAEKMASEWADVTETGTAVPSGHTHLVNQAIREITSIFDRAGFVRVRYPEVEWDWFAFEALNMPSDHPARDEWETFFMDAPVSSAMGKMLLTPHGSSCTARVLAERQLPIRVVNISKDYRRQMDVTHVPMFHQFDGTFVDKNVSLTNLIGILDYFVKAFFGSERKTRLRPFHFRFTEPSFEIDVSCGVCQGSGRVNGQKCRTCKAGWLELGGAGMLHPNVLKAAGIDPTKYSGLSFGWGVERTYMMKEGMQLDDLRTIYRNDERFLRQF